MRTFLLVLACAVIIGAVFDISLGGALFSLYFMVWVPFALIIGAVLIWQWRMMRRETPLSAKPKGLWRPDDVINDGKPSDTQLVMKSPEQKD